jgi:hypothetical protein
MARIPDKASNTASSIWKMNDVYVARNGDEWPAPFVPKMKCAFTRSTNGVLTGIYTGESNGDGTNIGSGSPMTQPWGYNWNSADGMNFWISTNGSESSYYLKWIMLSTVGNSAGPYNAQVTVRICGESSNTMADYARVYENTNDPFTLPSGNQSYVRYDLPATGNQVGTNMLTFGVGYTIGISTYLNTSYGSSYFDGTNYTQTQSHTVTSGSTWDIYWNSSSMGPRIQGWTGKANNGTSYSQGQLYMLGIEEV